VRDDEPVADFSVFDVGTLTCYDLGQVPGGPSARAEPMTWCVAEDDRGSAFYLSG